MKGGRGKKEGRRKGVKGGSNDKTSKVHLLTLHSAIESSSPSNFSNVIQSISTLDLPYPSFHYSLH